MDKEYNKLEETLENLNLSEKQRLEADHLLYSLQSSLQNIKNFMKEHQNEKSN